MKKYFFSAILLVSILAVTGCNTSGGIKSDGTEKGSNKESVVEVSGAPGATIKFVYVQNSNPVAHIVVIPGGKGNMGVSDGFFGIDFGKYSRWGSFTINTRKQFRDNGFSVAIVDWPKYRKGQKDVSTYGFRESKEHGQNILAVIKRMKQDADVPVWLLGHSRGTTTAASQSINLGKENVQGVVLSASIAAGPMVDTYVPDMALDRILVPALVMSAENDLCEDYTPREAAKVIGARMVNSPNVKVHYVKGAQHHQNSDKVCRTNSAHSYAGIEDDVADYISGFIKSNL